MVVFLLVIVKGRHGADAFKVSAASFAAIYRLFETGSVVRARGSVS